MGVTIINQSNGKDKDLLEKIAIEAAAKHSDKLAKAVLEFVRLAYIESVPPLINDPNDAGRIMQKLLPPYRFPANDLVSEVVSYYGWFDIPMHGTFCGTPPFFSELKKFNVPERLIQEIDEYTTEFENIKTQLNKCSQEKLELESRILLE
jgi:hypothetical protein